MVFDRLRVRHESRRLLILFLSVWQDIKSGSERMSKSSCSLLCSPWLTPPPPYRPGEWLQVSGGQDRGGRQRHREISFGAADGWEDLAQETRRLTDGPEWMGENLQRSQGGSEVHQRIDGFCKRDHDGGGRESEIEMPLTPSSFPSLPFVPSPSILSWLMTSSFELLPFSTDPDTDQGGRRRRHSRSQEDRRFRE